MTLNILVTGGNGFIGSHLTGALCQGDYKVTVLSRTSQFRYPEAMPADWQRRIELVSGDINDYALLERLVSNSDIIYHKAASVGVSQSGRFAKHFAETNIGGTANLVGVLTQTRHRVRKVVLGSSISVYGEGNYNCQKCGIVRNELRYTQGHFLVDGHLSFDPPCISCQGIAEPVLVTEDAELKGESVYAVTKKAQEDLLSGACKLRGISLAVLRYSTVYGPGQADISPYSEFMRLLALGRPPLVDEDGEQTRDFVSIQDVVAANLLILETNINGCVFLNVGSGVQTTVLDFAKELSRAFSEIQHSEMIDPIITGVFVPATVRHCNVDISRAKSKLKYSPGKPLKDGIFEMVDSFLRRKEKQ